MDPLNKTDMDKLIEALSHRDGSGLTGWRVSRMTSEPPHMYSSIQFDVSSPVERSRMEQLLAALEDYQASFGHITITVWGRREAPVEA